MGTMFGLQSSLNGAAGALAPPFGGWLYRLNIFLPFLCTSASCALTGLLTWSIFGILSVFLFFVGWVSDSLEPSP